MYSAAGVYLCFILAALVGVVVVLYLRHGSLQMLHHERMAALEKGVPVPVARTLAPWSPRVYLLRGLIWSASGLHPRSRLRFAPGASVSNSTLPGMKPGR